MQHRELRPFSALSDFAYFRNQLHRRQFLKLKCASLKLPASAFGARGRWRPERNNEDCSYSAGLVSRTFAVRRGDDYLQSPTSLADHVPYGTWISDGRWVRPASNTSRQMVRLANEHERASFQRTSLRPSITVTVLWMSAIMVRGGWQLDCKTPPVGHSVHWTVVLDLMNAVPYRSTTKEIYNGPSVVW